MRVVALLVPAALSLVAAGACSSKSSGSSENDSDASADGTSSSSGGSGSSSGCDTGSSSGPSSCQSPSDCPSSDVCCGKIPITGGTAPNCTTNPITISCAAACACATQLGTTCSGTQTVRLCQTNMDCTEPGASHCCTFGGGGDAGADGGGDGGGGTLSFCANAFVGAFGGGTCQ